MISSRPTRRDSLLFVYGTLRPFVEIAMAQWLRRSARYIGPAITRGRLYDFGPYPGMTRARGRRELVVGDVYRVTRPKVFRVLDRYEAGPARSKARFVRERCVVNLERGGCRTAWTYRYRYGVVGVARIESGDYRAHSRRSTPRLALDAAYCAAWMFFIQILEHSAAPSRLTVAE